MEPFFVNLKLDSVFKSFFVKPESKELLIDFLSGILDIPEEDISDVQIKNPEIPIEALHDKFIRLDLNLTAADRNINVEMQVQKDSNYRERAFYYTSKLACQLPKGKQYINMPQTIAVHILNHTLFKHKDYESVFQYYDAKHRETLTDRGKIIFFELTKLPHQMDVTNKKEMWLRLIKSNSFKQYNQIAASGGEIMAKAVRVIYDMSKDTRIRENARMREKAINDMYDAIGCATDKGIRIGESRGIKIGEDRAKAAFAKREAAFATEKAAYAEREASYLSEMAALKAELEKYRAAGIQI